MLSCAHKGVLYMQKYDYSLKTWILIAVLAVISLVVDALFYTGVWGGDSDLMRDTTLITTLVSGYILFRSVQGIIQKVKENKNP